MLLTLFVEIPIDSKYILPPEKLLCIPKEIPTQYKYTL